MSKKQRIIILIFILILILGAILISQNKNKNKIVVPNEAPVEKPEQYEIQNAFPLDETISPEDEVILEQVTRLKDMSPVASTDFSIEYSYKTGGFIVKSNKSLNATEKVLETWLNENGFKNIPDSLFEYQSSKLAL